MSRNLGRAIVWVVVSAVAAGASISLAARGGQGGADEQAVRQADGALVAALARGDSSAVGAMLDAEFAWTNSAGDTMDRTKALASLPKSPLGDEKGANVAVRLYGQAATMQAASGRVHVLRVWGKRPAGWKLVVFHEVTQREAPPPPGPPAPSTNDCENPCKGVPYTPKNPAEKAILKSWGELETAVTNHQPDVWGPHFLDEFVLISSSGTEPVDKAGRMKALSRPGIGPAPAALEANPPVRFVHFGGTVVMMSQTRPYSGKPAHISRVWVDRGGMWRMALSYQTTIQAAQPLAPPK